MGSPVQPWQLLDERGAEQLLAVRRGLVRGDERRDGVQARNASFASGRVGNTKGAPMDSLLQEYENMKEQEEETKRNPQTELVTWYSFAHY